MHIHDIHLENCKGIDKLFKILSSILLLKIDNCYCKNCNDFWLGNNIEIKNTIK